MAVSGAILREVGTTNITRLADYEKAIGPNTARPDAGPHAATTASPASPKSVAAGGPGRAGPQAQPAGDRRHRLAAPCSTSAASASAASRWPATASRPGPTWCSSAATSCSAARRRASSPASKELIQKIEKDPLMRAFRLDKMTLAALEATLRLYLNEERALREVPVLRHAGDAARRAAAARRSAGGAAAQLAGVLAVQVDGGRRLRRRRLVAGPDDEDVGGRGAAARGQRCGAGPAAAYWASRR